MGLGFRVWGSGFWGLGFRGLGFRVQGLGLGLSGLSGIMGFQVYEHENLRKLLLDLLANIYV